MHVLLVDDEQDFATALAARLELRGIHCVLATSGPDTLNLLATQPLPDLVFLDVHMPGMDGVEVLTQLRQRHAELDVVMLSAASDLHLAVRAMRRGAANWLPKPVEVEALLEECRRCSQRRRDRRQQEQLAHAAYLQSLGRVAEGVAHEVNNPVNIMLQAAGWVEDLLEDAEEACGSGLPLAEMRQALDSLRQQSLRVREITRRLLVFGKGMDREDKSMAALDMGVVVNKAVDMLRGQSHKVHMTIALPPDLPHPRGSAVELHQACVHVLENALEAMPEGGHLHISGGLRAATDMEDAAYLLWLRDSGKGIDPLHLPHVFEPFFSTKTGAAGLGLAVCQSLLRRRGGDVLVQNVPQGCLVTLILPLAQASEAV